MSKQLAFGKVRVQVIENGRVLREQAWKRNLILDDGLEFLGNGETWASVFLNALLGSGSTVTSDDSGAITASCSAASGTVTVTANAGIFSALYDSGAVDDCGSTLVGRTIRWDTGRTAKIVTYISDTQVTATLDSGAASATGQFTIYRTNQTGLESALTTNGLGWCSDYYAADTGTVEGPDGTFTMTRAFEFPTVTGGAVTVREFCVAPAQATPVFARVVLGTPETLSIGQALRVTYALVVTLSPIEATSQSATVTGIGVVGGEALCLAGSISRVAASTGAVEASAAQTTLDPSNTVDTFMVLCESDTVVPSAYDGDSWEEVAPSGTSSAANTRKPLSTVAYVAGSRYKDRVATWNTADAVYPYWNYLVIGSDEGGVYGGSAVGAAWMLTFTDPFNKDNGKVLTLRFRISWDRAW